MSKDIPAVGQTVVSPSGNEYVVCGRSGEGQCIELRDPHGTKLGWRYWSEQKGWRIKDDGPQWPDWLYEAAKPWAKYLEHAIGDGGSPAETVRPLLEAFREEERRRETQVCG